MSKRRVDPMWIIVGVILLIVAIAAIIYYLSKDERVRAYRDGFRSQADELKRQILEKESLVEWLKDEIQNLKLKKDSLLKKAKRLYLICKCLALALLAGTAIMIHAIWNLNMWELISTALGMSGLIITTLMIVIRNEVATINKVLKIWQTNFISMYYRVNGFEPELIAELECRLLVETENLAQLKERQMKHRHLS
jgi:hypothetical protein